MRRLETVQVWHVYLSDPGDNLKVGERVCLVASVAASHYPVLSVSPRSSLCRDYLRPPGCLLIWSKSGVSRFVSSSPLRELRLL